MRIIWLHIAFVNTLIETLNRRNPGEVSHTNFNVWVLDHLVVFESKGNGSEKKCQFLK